MPLYGGGNKNKKKGARRGQGNAQKSGVKGIAAQYITRNKAIKKLQVSLKDFRRLCILKGIYPRDPRKKKEGKDKTYYHVKDIQYLQHEPLLIKFRELKIFLKKYKKAVSRHDYSRARVLEEHKPVFSLAHLIKERYPTFQDALSDLDDPLSMVHLFCALPSNVVPGSKTQHTPEKAFDCERLAEEFSTLVIHTHALRKVFVSIKGIYYQAKVQGVDVTWLVPHQFNQLLPDDVDYRVMLTFLQFYSELLRFVNLKLFHDQGLNYPPNLDIKLYEKRAGFKSIQLQSKPAEAPAKTEAVKAEEEESHSAAAAAPVAAADKKALQKSVKDVVSKLSAKQGKGKAAAVDAMDVDEQAEEPKEEDVDDFAELRGESEASLATKTPAELDAYNAARVFSGMTFLLSREVPHTALEFVILCGGGKVESEIGLNPSEVSSTRFTHQIVDRPALQGAALSTRDYVQPQWVFDSFNSYHCVPVGPYAPGKVPPPHLSPFVKEEEEAEMANLPAAAQGTVYVPKQRAVLQSWGAKASWLSKKQSEFDAQQAAEADRADDAAEADEQAALAAEEARHARELQLERKGKSHSTHVEEQAAKKAKKAAAAAAKEEAEDEEDDEEVQEQDDDEDDGEADDSDGEGDIVPDSEDEEEEAPAPAARVTGQKRKATAAVDENAPSELNKAMMTKKNKRLHGRMMFGIKEKQAQVDKLTERREANEKKEQQQQRKKARK